MLKRRLNSISSSDECCGCKDYWGHPHEIRWYNFKVKGSQGFGGGIHGAQHRWPIPRNSCLVSESSDVPFPVNHMIDVLYGCTVLLFCSWALGTESGLTFLEVKALLLLSCWCHGCLRPETQAAFWKAWGDGGMTISLRCMCFPTMSLYSKMSLCSKMVLLCSLDGMYCLLNWALRFLYI